MVRYTGIYMPSTNPQPKYRHVAPFIFALLRSGIDDILRPLLHLPAEPIEINPNEVRIWWIGHASVFINLYGTTILTDPVLVNWIPWPRRIVASPYQAADLPKLDYVVISHAHLDHANRPTLRALAPKTSTLILPRNCSDLIRGMGFREIIELDWGGRMSRGGLEIQTFQPRHWGLRYPWERIDRGYNCYLFSKNGGSVFFGGDSAYGDFFKTIGSGAEIHTALLPIGAYRPPPFRQHHMDPEDAIQAFLDLKARQFIPIHYHTFRLSLEPLEEPESFLTSEAAARGLSDRVRILKQGQSIIITK